MADGVWLRAPCDFGEVFYRVKVGTKRNGGKFLYIQRCELSVANCGRAIRAFGVSAFQTLSEAQMVMKRLRETGKYG